MGINSNNVINATTRGDCIYRDAYIRGLTLSDTGDVQQGSFFISGNGAATWVSGLITKHTPADDTSSWSCYVKKAGMNIDTNSIPQVFVSDAQTTISSDSTSISGTLTVDNYASFGDDVDIPIGNVSIGRNLSVDGVVSVGTSVTVSGGLYSTTRGPNNIDFTDKWRIAYDASKNALVFRQKVTGNWVDMYVFDSTGLQQPV
jgi:hypothetical protein